MRNDVSHTDSFTQDIRERVLFTCPSTRRPDNVEIMEEWCPGLLWIVKDEVDQRDYLAAGAGDVFKQVEIRDGPSGILAARNTSLALARDEGLWCVQIDDDLQDIQYATGGDNIGTFPWSSKAEATERAAETLYTAMMSAGAHYGSLASNPNRFFARRRVNTWAFCGTQWCMIDPSQPEWFSQTIDLREEWEMTLRHLTVYGVVARLDWIVPTVLHLTNPGGLVDTRTDERVSYCSKYLLHTYPDLVRRSSRKTRNYDLQLIHGIKNTLDRRAKEAYIRVNRDLGLEVEL